MHHKKFKVWLLGAHREGHCHPNRLHQQEGSPQSCESLLSHQKPWCLSGRLLLPGKRSPHMFSSVGFRDYAYLWVCLLVTIKAALDVLHVWQLPWMLAVIGHHPCLARHLYSHLMCPSNIESDAACAAHTPKQLLAKLSQCWHPTNASKNGLCFAPIHIFQLSILRRHACCACYGCMH